MPSNDNLTFAADGGGKPIVPLCSGKQATESRILSVCEKTDNAAILRELARVKCEFQMRAVVAAMGVGL